MKLKLIMIGVFGLGTMFMVYKFLGQKDTVSAEKEHKAAQSDKAILDTPVETMKELSAKMELLSARNAELLAEKALADQQHLAQMAKVEARLADELEKMHKSIKETQKEYELSSKLNSLVENQLPEYTVQTQTQTPVKHISWVSDVNPNYVQPIEKEDAYRDNTITNLPYLTVPKNATLMDAVTMTALIGRIPVNGKVTAPYPFKTIIGKENLASNGLDIPELEGIVASGIANGDMQLSCVRGEIQSLTFSFQDGTIATTSKEDGEGLGYLSMPNGNPCVNGTFYTNAHQFLANQIGLSGLEGAAGALAETQMTRQRDAVGGNSGFVSGNVGRFMGGKAGEKGLQSAQQWLLARQSDSFDAVYVPANQNVVVNITSEIQIDYNKLGRKVRHSSYQH